MAETLRAGMTNGINQDKLKGYVQRAEAIKNEMESKKGEYLSWCKNKRAEIKELKKDAAADSIPQPVFTGVLTYRETKANLEAIRSALEPEQMDLFDDCLHKLGMINKDDTGDGKVVPLRPEQAPPSQSQH